MDAKYVSTALLLSLSCAANAIPIVITGYDIDNTYVSETGGWRHSYTGIITPVSGGIANYSGGSGTLNDGIIGTSVLNTQLFNYPTDSSPVITLFLDDFYTINSLLIHGGDFLGNTIPGELTGLDVTINSTLESFVTVPQGPTDGTRYADDGISFGGSSLDGLVTNSIILSGFDSTWSSFNTFSITEIELDGELASSVPEPSAILLLGLGLAGLGLAVKKQAV